MRATSSELTAEATRASHPSRLERSLATNANPWMAWVGALAPLVREHRHPVSQDNPFVTVERAVSAQITSALDQYRDARDAWYEQVFEFLYQSPMMAALVGLEAQAPVNLESPVTVQLRKELAQRRLHDAEAAIEQGGMREAFVRVLAYVADAGAAIEERPFNLLRQMAREQPEGRGHLTLAEFKSLVRRQTFIVRLDRRRALEALPLLVPDQDERRRLMVAAHRVLTVIAPLEGERLTRYREVAEVLGTDHAHGGARSAEAPQASVATAGNGQTPVVHPESGNTPPDGKRRATGPRA